VTRVGAIKSSGIKGVVISRGVLDGVIIDTSAQMARVGGYHKRHPHLGLRSARSLGVILCGASSPMRKERA
jgi:hypothetical protein